MLGIVTLAVSSYLFIGTLERVFDDHVESHRVLEQPGEEALGSGGDVAPGQNGAELDAPPSTIESPG